MNVAITLPQRLSQAIISGNKTVEVRKSYAKNCQAGKDGFFVIKEGTDDVVCWCRVWDYSKIDVSTKAWRNFWFNQEGQNMGISKEEFHEYCKSSNFLYLWYIDKTIVFSPALHKSDLKIDKDPQSFSYTPVYSENVFY